jgi:hypothetical protein
MTPSPFLAPDCRHCTHSLLYRSEHLRFAELTRTDRYSQNVPRPAGAESRNIGAECSPAAATTATEPVAVIEVMVGSGTAAQPPQFQLGRLSWVARGGTWLSAGGHGWGPALGSGAPGYSRRGWAEAVPLVRWPVPAGPPCRRRRFRLVGSLPVRLARAGRCQ